MKFSLGISNFLEAISSLSHSIVFLYFFALITEEVFLMCREYFTHGHHQMVNTEIRLVIFFAAKDGEALYSQQNQDWELTVAQIMNFLLPNSDLGETIKPFRYDLNQIPYNHTVEVTNRFKGLGLIDRVPEELWMEVRDIL